MEKAPRLKFSKENNPNFDLEDIHSSDRKIGETAASYLLTILDKKQLEEDRRQQREAELLNRLEEAERRERIDSFTGCYNRVYLEAFIENEFDPNKDDGSLALVFTDLDNLKEVNDTRGYGHPAGDELIKALVKRLRSKLGEDTIIVRTGGDEFLCLIRNKTEDKNFQDDLKGNLESSRGAKLSEISQDIDDDYRNITLDYSYGIAIYDKSTDLVFDGDAINKRATISKVLKRSDDNMYAYKETFKQKKIAHG